MIVPVPGRDHARWSLRSAYVEVCWLPVLGPTAVAVLRLLSAVWAEQVPAEVDDLVLARMLGLGTSERVHHTAKRLEQFRVGSWDPMTRLLQVPVSLPSLTGSQLARVPEWVRHRHHAMVAEVEGVAS